MTTSGVRDRNGPRKVGQCRTSAAVRGRSRGYQTASAASVRSRDVAGKLSSVDVDVQMVEQAAQIARGAGPRLEERRRVDRYANRSYPSRKISPARRHEKLPACARPSARSSSRRDTASRMPSAIACGALGVGAHGRVAACLVQRRVRRGDDGRARRHRLGDRHAEALEPRRVDDDRRAAVEPRQLGVGDAAEPHDARPVELGLRAPAGAARDDEREAEVGDERKRLDERAQVLARLERRHRERIRRAELCRLALRGELGADARMRDQDAVAREARAWRRRRRR